jgi:hypothetical protein
MNKIDNPNIVFYKQSSSSDGLQSDCKDCKLKSFRSKHGVIGRMYTSQKQSSKRRKHPMPNYSKNELIEWVLGQSDFLVLYENWVLSDYDKKMIPSCDRLNDSKPYTFDNIRLVTWQENLRSWQESDKDCKGSGRIVIQYSLSDELIQTFSSLVEAKNNTGIGAECISKVCRGIRYTAGGFKWKFA